MPQQHTFLSGNILQAVRLVREIGGITVRGNHDEAALEVYEAWKKSGELAVSFTPTSCISYMKRHTPGISTKT